MLTPTQKADFIAKGRASVVNDLIMSGDTDAAKTVLSRLLADNKYTDNKHLWNSKAKLALSLADHDEVMAIAAEMTQVRGLPRGHYYAAQSYLARGNDKKAMFELQTCLFFERNQSDAVYLLCDLSRRMGEEDMARNALLRLAKVSRRPKTWLCLANLVETESQFLEMQHAWKAWSKGIMKNAYNKDARTYLALAAVRVGHFELANAIWRQSLLDGAKKSFAKLRTRDPNYASNRAEVSHLRGKYH